MISIKRFRLQIARYFTIRALKGLEEDRRRLLWIKRITLPQEERRIAEDGLQFSRQLHRIETQLSQNAPKGAPSAIR